MASYDFSVAAFSPIRSSRDKTMKSKKHFVSVNKVQQGPYDLVEITAKVKQGQLSPTDFIFSEEKNDWVLLIEHPELLQQLKSDKPATAPIALSETQKATKEELTAFKTESNPMVTHWHVLKGETKFGPFSFPELIKMLQEKIVFEFDFVWTTGMSNWQRIAELEDFKPDNIKKLKSSLMPEIKEVFFRRKHPRLSFEGNVIVHDKKQVWRAQSVELSAGGAGLIIENSTLVPGQVLHMHFKAHGNVPTFNVTGEIVSKKYTNKISGRDSSVCYGIKFSNLEKNLYDYLIEQTTKVGKLTAA